MTRLTFRLFGFPIFSFDLQNFVLVEEVEEEQEDAPTHIEGGSAHNFTLAPQYVDERYMPWEEDRFGFR
jgi:hypothetical protein